MRFIHMADVHIGAKPDNGYAWGNEREKEIIESFYDVLRICNEEEIDLLLIAGDLYQRQPLIRELSELNDQFSKLKKTRVVLIAGNHDYIGPRSNYREFEWADNVTMLKGEKLEKVDIPELNTEVYGFSYHTRNIPQSLYDHVKPDHNDRMHILLAHGGDNKNIPIDKTAIKELPFDYIALGHIHKPEILSPKAAYCGSFEPLDKAELGARGYILGDLSKENISIKFIPHSRRKYEWMNIHVNPQFTNRTLIDEIKHRIHVEGDQDIYRIRLIGYRDVDVCFDREGVMRCGNVIELVDDSIPDYDFERIRENNKENIIGLYIDKIHESMNDDDVKIKALYYGLEALISANNHFDGGNV